MAATRVRSASSSASEVTGTVNGRTAVAPADFSVVTDMWNSLVLVVVLDVKMTALERAVPFRGGQAVEGELIVRHELP